MLARSIYSSTGSAAANIKFEDNEISGNKSRHGLLASRSHTMLVFSKF